MAGCTSDSTDETAIDSPVVSWKESCDLGICTAVEGLMAEVDLQPNAVPLLGFDAEQIGRVHAMARTDDGWALIIRDGDGERSVVVINELDLSTRQFVMPAGHTADEGSLLLDGQRLIISSWQDGARDGITLHEWNLRTDAIESNDFDVPIPAHPVGVWDDQVLLVAKKGLLGGNSAVWVADGAELVPITGEGRIMDAAMATGLLYVAVESEGNWSVQMRDVAGSISYPIWDESEINVVSIDGIWGNDGHIAFSAIRDTSDPAGGQLFEINHKNHSTSPLGQGYSVHFTGDEQVHYLTAAEGTSPFMAEWSRSLDAASEGQFLPDGMLWDVTSDGAWWLEIPRTDYRFREAPNPTPYSIMLMASDR
jgi:hypothetical protein